MMTPAQQLIVRMSLAATAERCRQIEQVLAEHRVYLYPSTENRPDGFEVVEIPQNDPNVLDEARQFRWAMRYHPLMAHSGFYALVSRGPELILKAIEHHEMAKRVDANQKQIVTALERRGCTVQLLSDVGKGCPDLLVGIQGINLLMEVKAEDGGRMTPDQQAWHAHWNGCCYIVRTWQEALEAVDRELGLCRSK